MDIYLEIGKKKTFAAAMNWPGYSRWGRDEESALQALLAYGPRYASAMEFAAYPVQPTGCSQGVRYY
jgi:hypothetical protein